MRRTLRLALVLVVALVLLASRCDRRGPGVAESPDPVTLLPSGAQRHDVRFPCGDSECAGWLHLPPGDARTPGVVMGHGFGGTRDVGLAHVAEEFASNGLAALAIDYRYFGASGGTPRQIVDVWCQLDDWRAAVAFLRAHSRIDPARVALWGTSMGAGHALIVAAEDPTVRAVVGQSPLIDTAVEGEATYYGAGWLARLLLSGWADFFLSAFGREPFLIPAIARSGEFGMLADDAAYAAFERVTSPGGRYRNAVAARSIFLFDRYDPAAVADRIAVPVLLIGSPRDRFTPFAALEAYAARRKNVTLETVDGDHFDVYSPPLASHAAETARRFLTTHLQ
jgi:pimeloyl-ACP methyl ester carboxylesterase